MLLLSSLVFQNKTRFMKQQEREQRRRGKKKKAETKKQKEYTVPEDVVLTLDMITDPNK